MTTDTEELIEKLERAHRMSTSDPEAPVGTLWGAAAAELTYLVAELRQERERADAAERHLVYQETKNVDALRSVKADLARAEETIEKVRDIVTHDGAGQDWRIRRALAEYGEQKGRADE